MVAKIHCCQNLLQLDKRLVETTEIILQVLWLSCDVGCCDADVLRRQFLLAINSWRYTKLRVELMAKLGPDREGTKRLFKAKKAVKHWWCNSYQRGAGVVCNIRNSTYTASDYCNSMVPPLPMGVKHSIILAANISMMDITTGGRRPPSYCGRRFPSR